MNGTVATLAGALAELVRYVAGRPAAATEDDDVRALEDAAATLASLPRKDQQRLQVLMDHQVVDALGLDRE